MIKLEVRIECDTEEQLQVKLMQVKQAFYEKEIKFHTEHAVLLADEFGVFEYFIERNLDRMSVDKKGVKQPLLRRINS